MNSFLQIGIVMGGVISLLVANGHRQFYKFFGWKNLFQGMTEFDSKVIYTIHLFLIPIFLLYTYLSFFHVRELAQVQTPLARDLLVFYSLFWFCRGVWQLLYFKKDLDQNSQRALRVRLVVVAASVSSCIIYTTPILMKFLKLFN